MGEIVFCEKDRNYEIENLGIKMFAEKVKGCISEEDIRDTLIKNGFNGIYMLPEDQFNEVREDENVKAYYMPDEKKIIVNKDYYQDHKDIIIHELVHAYLNDNSRVTIEINEEFIDYGYGLEEGCCTVIQKTNDINTIEDSAVDVYIYQSHLVKQLNELYKYSPDKKYPNLIHHLLKEPKDFLPAVSRIYESILSKLNLDEDINIREIALRSALSIVTTTDSMVDNKNYNPKSMYTINSCMNTVYLYLASKKIRNENKTNDLFPNFSETQKNDPERLIQLLFGSEVDYFKRQVNIISKLLMMQQEELENCSRYTTKIVTYAKKKF